MFLFSRIIYQSKIFFDRKNQFRFFQLGEHRFTEPIERMMFVRGDDLLIKFRNDLQILTYTLVGEE